MAVEYAEKYLTVNKVIDNQNNNYCSINSKDNWKFSDNPKYIYYTPNETISGLRFSTEMDLANCIHEFNLDNKLLVADMTSCILSEPINVSNYGIIFASAQKNLGPSGSTLMIIREDLLQSNEFLPDTYNYLKLAEKNSLLNTPPTYNIYIMNLVLKWMQGQGGVENIYKNNIVKSQKLYDFIDQSNFYSNPIMPEFRSLMNVTFNIADASLEKEFIYQAEDNKLYNLEGHRTLGGFRASIYNAMPMAGINKLIGFMQEFANSKGWG